MSRLITLIVSISTILFAYPALAWEVNENSFRCIKEMRQVDNFFVDNLAGNLDGTLAVALAGSGEYPEGSVVQLIPGEVMVKREKGFSAITNDWEFFALDVKAEGATVFARGAVAVNNQLGLNCFGCHVKAKPEFDFVCRSDHECDPVGITKAMFTALQNTDPRCDGSDTVSAEDQKALEDLGAVIEALLADK